ncbi:hypothetical protein [Roseateles sp. P5_E11]
MPTRMQHPEHGFMYAVDSGDFKRLTALGWTPEVPPKVDEPASVVGPEAVEPKRRGRPPKA